MATVDFSSLFKGSAKPSAASGGTPGRSTPKQRSRPKASINSKQKVHAKPPAKPVQHASTAGGVSKRKRKCDAQRRVGLVARSITTQPPTSKIQHGGFNGRGFKGSIKGSGLQSKLEAQLAGAQFRHINEKLYTSDSVEAQRLFQHEPELYAAYHQGFRSQTERWPLRPVDVFVTWLAKQPDTWLIGDMGCGDAEIALCARQRVLSFDLLETNERVTACDIAKLPLSDGTLDVAIFCLSLMGANYGTFLHEAHRVLRVPGVLKVAEVRSRFEDVSAWIKMIRAIGFNLVDRRDDNTHFVFFEFQKLARTTKETRQHVPLKPCIYKRR